MTQEINAAKIDRKKNFFEERINIELFLNDGRLMDMIKLTKFNSEAQKKGEFVLNAEIIETIEETPDTVVTLTNGKKLIVDESMDDIVRRVMKYRRALKQF